MYKFFSSIALASALSIPFLGSVNAADWGVQMTSESTLLPAEQMSAGEAARIVKEQTGGRILKVTETDAGSFSVKVLLPSGEVRTVVVEGKAE